MRGTVIASIVLFAFTLAFAIIGVPMTSVGAIRMVRYKSADPEVSHRYRSVMITGAMFNTAAVIALAIAIGLLPWSAIVSTVKGTHQALMSSVRR